MSVIVYSTPTCPFCKKVKTYLQEHQIAFTDVDVMGDQEQAAEMIKKSGQMGVPVIDIDGEIVIGFDEKKLKELIQHQS